MNVLAIFAHGDDETLGCGGTLARHVVDGHVVRVLPPFTNGVSARVTDSDDARARYREWLAAVDALGARTLGSVTSLGFPDQKLDTVGTLALAKCVEGALRMFDADVIYTHWHGDLNRDHQCVAEAVFVATRLAAGSTVGRVLACEIPESTSQAFGLGAPFEPNLYVDVSAHLRSKLEALRCYASEKREPPHLRSQAGVVTHAGTRGGEAGCDFAEAFMIMREVMR